MDRKLKTKLAALIVMILWQCITVSPAIAAPATPEKNQTQPHSTASTEGKPADKKSTTRFPYLQRALIIATIVNFVVIIFALAIYVVKRRMNQFSPVPRAMGQQQS